MTDLLKDNTNKALLSMSLPVSIGMLSTFLFQIIDTYFVGQLGANALAALSFASSLYFLMVGLFIGLSVGVSILIGKAAGEKNIDKVKSIIIIALFLCFLAALLFSATGIYFMEPIFLLLGASRDILPLIKAYLVPLLMGTPLLTIGLLCGGILRATGNVTKPEALMALAGVINLIFDYGLIFGKWGLPELGISGAAIASILSWVFIFLGMFVFLIQDQLLSFSIKLGNVWRSILEEIFKLSAPTIVTQIIGPFTLMYLTFLFAQQSEMAVAAFGVAGRIEILLLIGILGVSTAITPFIAQNAGANLQKRIDEAIVFGGKATIYLGLIVALILYLFIQPIAGLFSENQEIVQYTASYFYFVSLSYVFYGLFLITTSIFNGLQLPFNSLKISLIKSLIFTVPFTLLGSLWGVNGIFTGLALSNVAAGIYSAIKMQAEIKRTNSDLAKVNISQSYWNDLKAIFGK